MSSKNQNKRIIFGLKVKQLRQEKQLSFEELSKATGISISYLNEIEKGKKYPKPDKLAALANALGQSLENLKSEQLTGSMAPVGELLRSNFLNELPLELFGIELSKIAGMIANAPIRVGAFISTLVELARNYALHEEHFFIGAMRAYQELHFNYFEDIEEDVIRFVQKESIPIDRPVRKEELEAILKKRYRYKIIKDGLKDYPELKGFRSVYLPHKKTLLLNSDLKEDQIIFQYGKEIAYNFYQLKNRSITSSLTRVNNFDQVLSHSKAAYFSVALLINQEKFIQDLTSFFKKDQWEGDAFLALMKNYEASPGMLFQRLTSIIPKFFGLRNLFFLRCIQTPETDYYEVDIDLHFTRRQRGHSNGLFEHYCRRWSALSLLKELQQHQENGKNPMTIVGAQRSSYTGTSEEYLCITLARPSYPPGKNVSFSIGLLMDEALKQQIHFWDDPKITRRVVNTTCQRCAIEDCNDRAAPATIVQQKRTRKKQMDALKKLMGEN